MDKSKWHKEWSAFEKEIIDLIKEVVLTFTEVASSNIDGIDRKYFDIEFPIGIGTLIYHREGDYVIYYDFSAHLLKHLTDLGISWPPE